jgi:hypothetical protein
VFPGCYLTSTVHLTGALFAEMVRVRQAYPYLRPRDRQRDAELAGLILRLQLVLRGVGGIFTSVQLSIGHDLITDDGDRIASYPEFVDAVRDPDRAPWYDQLVTLYNRAVMKELSAFLDKAVGATSSVSSRLQAEVAAGSPSTDP